MGTRRTLTTATTVAVLALAAACGGDGGSEDRSDSDSPSSTAGTGAYNVFREDEFGIEFSYPVDFRPGEVSRVEASNAPAQARTALVLDKQNGILVSKYVVGQAVTPQNVEDAVPEVDSVVADLIGAPAHGRPLTVGDLPAVAYDSVAVPDPPGAESRLVFIFDDTTEYLINCQWTAAKRVQVEQACDTALETLKRR